VYVLEVKKALPSIVSFPLRKEKLAVEVHAEDSLVWPFERDPE
jgi:hypothetical protein